MNGWPASFVQMLIFINVLFVICLRLLTSCFERKLWKCIFNSRIAFNYTDYEWNMAIIVCEQFFYKKFNLQKGSKIENMKAKDPIWIFLYNWRSWR